MMDGGIKDWISRLKQGERRALITLGLFIGGVMLFAIGIQIGRGLHDVLN